MPAAPDAQFVIDIGDVVLNRVNRDKKLLLNLSVAPAPQDEPDDVRFPQGEASIPAESHERLPILGGRRPDGVGLGEKFRQPDEGDEVNGQQGRPKKRE